MSFGEVVERTGNGLTRNIVLAGKSFHSYLPPKQLTDVDLKSEWDKRVLLGEIPQVPTPKSGRLRIVDLYCGAGGLSLGARMACEAVGLQADFLFAADNHPEVLAVYS